MIENFFVIYNNEHGVLGCGKTRVDVVRDVQSWCDSFSDRDARELIDWAYTNHCDNNKNYLLHITKNLYNHLKTIDYADKCLYYDEETQEWSLNKENSD